MKFTLTGFCMYSGYSGCVVLILYGWNGGLQLWCLGSEDSIWYLGCFEFLGVVSRELMRLFDENLSMLKSLATWVSEIESCEWVI